MKKNQSYTIGYKLQVIEFAKQYGNGAAKRILDHLQQRKESATSWYGKVGENAVGQKVPRIPIIYRFGLPPYYVEILILV